MADIHLVIESEDAIAATESLLAIPGISGNYEVSSEATEREPILTTVATIVGIFGGTTAIAEQIRKWYHESKAKQPGKTIAKVLIVGRNGRRLLLEDATVEEIRQIIEG
ncbi:MAG TPA: hypothetical protein IGS40_12985 [Trichormus sp. M33_DOE_039]|nr:hypothetical protein [Trichormus sp. M33_DOE_039]